MASPSRGGSGRARVLGLDFSKCVRKEESLCPLGNTGSLSFSLVISSSGQGKSLQDTALLGCLFADSHVLSLARRCGPRVAVAVVNNAAEKDLTRLEVFHRTGDG